jgi:hypothetical protein
VGERGFLLAYLFCLALAILFLCIRSHKDLQFLPLFINATYVSLILGTTLIQAITGPPQGILMPILLRILVPFLLFSSLCIFARRKWPRFTFEYGHLIFLQTLVNLCVFGSLDFFLLVVFFILFLITQFIRHSHRRTAFLLVGVLSFCIYLPLMTTIVQNADRNALYTLTTSGFLFPAIGSLLILPFLLMWLEILSTVKRPLIVTVAIAALFLSGGLVSSHLLSLSNAPRYSAPPTIFLDPIAGNTDTEETDDPPITVNTDRELFFDEYEIVTVTVQSDLPLICLDMAVTSVETAKSAAVSGFITSSNPFATTLTERNLSFLPPEFPPNPLSFSYTVPRDSLTVIHTTFYLLGENNTILQGEALSEP